MISILYSKFRKTINDGKVTLSERAWPSFFYDLDEYKKEKRTFRYEIIEQDCMRSLIHFSALNSLGFISGI